MKVAVGSRNPVKIQAVENAFSQYFRDIEIMSVEVNSGVSNQPYDEDIKIGAETRARTVMKEAETEFGVGLEGGIITLYGVQYLAGYCAIINQQQEYHGSWGTLWELPPFVLRELETGMELGDVIDRLTKRKNTKQTDGAIGIFSKGVILREVTFRHTVIGALIPFVNAPLYKTI